MLDLYIINNCPYCKKVLNFLDNKKIKINIINIENNDNTTNALIRIGGKKQVPFLIDKDRNIQLYESNDIIEYIKTII